MNVVTVGHVRWFRTLERFLACNRLACNRLVIGSARVRHNRPRNDLNLCHLRRRTVVRRSCR
jgi:hypothetical protein